MPGSDNPEILQQGVPAEFQQVQCDFAAHLRAPSVHAAPPGIEDRRVGIYRDLIYNNIESFIASGFPVLRSIYGDAQWHALVREFVQLHTSQSPYFLQISEEFLLFLQNERSATADDPPFLLELAHYEWVELALDVSTEIFPASLDSSGDVLTGVPVVSPLAWSLSYRYPVHRIGPTFQPREAPDQPTFLVVYRDRTESVGFMETNAVTARLLQMAEPAECSGRELLENLATELQHGDREALVEFGRTLLQKLVSLGVIAGLK